MAVASAGPYASLHLTPDCNHASTPPLKFFYRPEQRQSTEGIDAHPEAINNYKY